MTDRRWLVPVIVIAAGLITGQLANALPSWAGDDLGSDQLVIVPLETPTGEAETADGIGGIAIEPPALDDHPLAAPETEGLPDADSRSAFGDDSATSATSATDCVAPCLIRLRMSDHTDQVLADLALRPAYVDHDAIWLGVTPADLDLLTAQGAEPVFIEDQSETLDLYVVRPPSGATDLDAIKAFGEIIDQSGSQYIVRVEMVPPVVTSLTNQGIWVEKFPVFPPRQSRIDERAANIPHRPTLGSDVVNRRLIPFV